MTCKHDITPYLVFLEFYGILSFEFLYFCVILRGYCFCFTVLSGSGLCLPCLLSIMLHSYQVTISWNPTYAHLALIYHRAYRLFTLYLWFNVWLYNSENARDRETGWTHLIIRWLFSHSAWSNPIYKQWLYRVIPYMCCMGYFDIIFCFIPKKDFEVNYY